MLTECDTKYIDRDRQRFLYRFCWKKNHLEIYYNRDSFTYLLKRKHFTNIF